MTLPKSGYKAGGGSGGGAASANAVEAAAVIPDNEIVRGDGGARGVQGSGITIADGATGTLAGSNSGDVTLAGTPDYITLAGQVLTCTKLDPADDLNTFASSVLATLLTDETGTDKVVFNTDPVFASTITVPNVGLHLLDTNASHDLIIKPGSDLTADHTLTVTTGDADRTLTLTGDASISGTNTGDGIGGSTGSTDNAILRADGTGGATVQASDIILADNETIRFPSDGVIEWSDSATPGSGNITNRLSRHGDSFLKFTNPNASGDGTLYFVLGAGSNRQAVYASGPLRLNSDGGYIRFTSGGSWEGPQLSPATDLGAVFVRSTATTSPAYLLTGRLVEANTAVAASPNVLTALESGTVLTNEGTTAKNYHTLPTAAAGYHFRFIVQDADGLRVTAAGGDTIRLAGSLSATAGYAESTTIGDMIDGFSVNATEWICSFTGTGWAVV